MSAALEPTGAWPQWPKAQHEARRWSNDAPRPDRGRPALQDQAAETEGSAPTVAHPAADWSDSPKMSTEAGRLVHVTSDLISQSKQSLLQDVLILNGHWHSSTPTCKCVHVDADPHGPSLRGVETDSLISAFLFRPAPRPRQSRNGQKSSRVSKSWGADESSCSGCNKRAQSGHGESFSRQSLTAGKAANAFYHLCKLKDGREETAKAPGRPHWNLLQQGGSTRPTKWEESLSRETAADRSVPETSNGGETGS